MIGEAYLNFGTFLVMLAFGFCLSKVYAYFRPKLCILFAPTLVYTLILWRFGFNFAIGAV